jgi:hypothetical protein
MGNLKKIVVFETAQVGRHLCLQSIVDFAGMENVIEKDYKIYIKTSEGNRLVSPNDLIIKDVNGVFHLVKAEKIEEIENQLEYVSINEQIENNFKYHTPKEGQPEKYTAVREKAKELAYFIDALCPNSREKSVALTNLETAVMWANSAIARNE